MTQKETLRAGPLPRSIWCALALTIAVFVGQNAFGQFTKVNDTTVFELDGNAVDNAASTGDDWTNLNPPLAPASTATGGSFEARSFIADGTTGATIFTTGGSKDDLDITSWQHTNGSVPDKDDIVNAYAAAYNVGGELVIYFGLDRFATNGDANAGFWFLQAGGLVNPNVAGKFIGEHRDHDILVLSTFTRGGSVPTIEVLEWNPTFCQGAGSGLAECNVTSNKTLRKLFPTGTVAAQCDTINSPNVCGISNAAGSITVDWSYQAKTGGTPAGTVPVAGFFEGGINLNRILPSGTPLPCITTFLAETRSSSSEDAQLKDFASGSFPVCGLEISKACPTCNIINNGTTFQYPVNGTVTNTGFGSIHNVVVTDDAGTPNNTADDLVFNLGTIAGGATVAWGGGTNDFFTSTTQNPASNTATVTGSFDAAGTQPITPVSTDLITCGTCPVNPTISVNKTCVAGPALVNGQILIKVDFSGSVSNTGNIQLNSVAVSEDHDANGVIDVAALPLSKSGTACGTSCALAPGESADFSGSYFPSVLNVVSPGRASFSDTVRASGTAAIPPFPTANATPATALCLLCPLGSAECPFE